MKNQFTAGLVSLLVGTSTIGTLSGSTKDCFQAIPNFISVESIPIIYNINSDPDFEGYTPKYHPKIEKYEGRIEKEVSPLIPTFFEFENLVNDEIYDRNLFLKFAKVRENPPLIHSKEYDKFNAHLKVHYQNPNKKGFIGQSESLADVLEDEETLVIMNEILRGKLGFSINVFKPSEEDKASMFLFYLNNIKERKIEQYDMKRSKDRK